ncbi:ABC transporter permease [Zavarzinia compransoris]|uniref:Transport permease protein n=1 Tax=Zavarzinia compransoris TaxID=1264899 RepID=A0A317E4R2_9PROT|nr:ABC transporter permease [Zavarzinia compransoris]PWR22118.1 ABC transporter [Zavarzinia compransoris]TDP47135.1 ABC-2 type transport system permease protein [Zavarzinia compransoris]
MSGAAGRVAALILRHWYLLRSSWPRLLEMIYWPTVQMLTWGFITLSLRPGADVAGLGLGALLGAAMLWDVLLRAQLGTSLSFLEEMYSRNLGHLLASPLRPGEMLVALALVGLIRTLIGMVPTSLLAIWFFGYSVYDLGLALAAFFALLVVMGWSVSLFVAGLIMRVGLGAEGLAWGLVFALAPLSAVFYPVSVLPGGLQPVALALPSTHVFEGMRILIAEGRLDFGHLAWAAGLDALFLGLGIAAFLGFHRSARRRGRLLQTGE